MKKYLKPVQPYIFLGFIFSVVSDFALALMPYFTQELLKSHFKSAITGYVLCICTYLCCNYVQMRLDWKQAIVFSTMLKDSWFASIIALPQTKFKQKSVPEYISYQSNDLEALEKDYLPPLTSFYKQVLRMVVFGVIITNTVNATVAIILLVSALLSIQIPKKTGAKTSRKRERYLKSQQGYYHRLSDLLSGQHLSNERTSKSFQERQSASLAKLQNYYLEYGLVKSWGLILNGISFELTGVVLFIYLAISLKNKSMNIPEAAASLAYISSFSEPIQEILYDIQIINSVKTVKDSFLKIVSVPKNKKHPIGNFNEIRLVDIFENIGDLKLTVPELLIHYGDKIALVGGNGSGKTSFLNILTGLSDMFQGHVYIDGKEIESMDNVFGMILQDEHTFEGNYVENITVFGSYRMKRLNTAQTSKMATNLSGGEQQLMYIDRVINQDSPLLILDEPFSALDEKQFDNSLEQLLALSSALIVVLHQKENVLDRFDHIWQMDNGRLKIVR